ncbi:MAG TPA: hypothetical protein VNF07_03890 [Acidimicrobiales bacterium]|nr:hypothetical protein [Acidimicrobiales bacterium]
MAPIFAVASPAVRLAFDVYRDRFARSVDRISDHPELSIDELVDRCTDLARRHLLTRRTLAAVRDAGSESQLFLLAGAFAHGATSDDANDVGLETLMAQGIGCLEEASLRVLSKFTLSVEQNGLPATTRYVPDAGRRFVQNVRKPGH